LDTAAKSQNIFHKSVKGEVMKSTISSILAGGVLAGLLIGQNAFADEREDYRKQMEATHQQHMQAEKERAESWKRERDEAFEQRKREHESEREAMKQRHEAEREAMKQQQEAEHESHMAEMEARKAEAKARHESMRQSYERDAKVKKEKKEKREKKEKD
jgi:hypothetical protein